MARCICHRPRSLPRASFPLPSAAGVLCRGSPPASHALSCAARMRVVLPGGHRALYFLPRDTFHTSYLTSRVSSAPLLAQPRVLVSLTRPLTFTPLTRDVCVFLFFSALAHSLSHTQRSTPRRAAQTAAHCWASAWCYPRLSGVRAVTLHLYSRAAHRSHSKGHLCWSSRSRSRSAILPSPVHLLFSFLCILRRTACSNVDQHTPVRASPSFTDSSPSSPS